MKHKNIRCFARNGSSIFAGTISQGIFISTDEGQSWTQTSLNDRWVYSLAVDGSVIYAGTYIYGVYKSTDNGQTWFQTSVNNNNIYTILITGGRIFAGGMRSMYISSDNGQSWVTSAFNNTNIYSLAVSGSQIYAGTGDYYNSHGTGVYVSSDNGQTWIQTSLNNKIIASFIVIGSKIFAGADPSGVYLSSDNGISWVPKNEGLGNSNIVSFISNNDYLFAGTRGGSVWKRSLSELIGITNISTEVPKEFSLSQNYPNPFNPSTKIRFQIPKSGLVNMAVYDILGREITTLVNEELKPGIYEAEWDASNYPSGVYYYKLFTNEFSETRKAVLIK